MYIDNFIKLSPGSEVTEEDNEEMKKSMALIYYLNETEI